MKPALLALSLSFMGLSSLARADEGTAALRWQRARLLDHHLPASEGGRRRPDSTGTIDLERVQVTFDVPTEGSILPPTGRIEVRALAGPEPVAVVPLLAFFFEPLTVATAAGRALDFRRDPETGELFIDLGAPVAPGAAVDLVMEVAFADYCLEPSSCFENGPFRHLVEYGWYPLSAEFPVEDRFTLELAPAMPRGWSAVGVGGREEPVEERGLLRWRWTTEEPTVLGALAVGPTRPVSVDGRVEVFVPPATVDDARMIGTQAQETVAFYERLLGPFPFSRLGVAPIADEAGVGLGPQANILLPVTFWLIAPDQIEAALVRQVLSHEIGHQYFFNLLGVVDLAEGWMSEGFAEYAATRLSEAVTGRTDHARLNYWEYVLGVDEAADLPLNSEALGVDDSFTRVLVMYDKGSVVLHQLRARIDDFDLIFRRYIERFRGEIVTTQDLQRFLEEATGRSLEGYFSQWVRRAGFPRLRVRAVRPRDDAAAVTLEIEQLPNRHGRFTGALPVVVTDAAGGAQRAQIELGSPTQAVEAPDAQRIHLDPDLTVFRLVLPEPAADVNLTGVVDGIDLLDLWAAQGRSTPDPAWDDALDANRDQRIDDGDLRVVAETFGAGW
ncbi:MAG: M1 family aminopeptidase [bacterium]